mmetsp:Transcript_18194/g.46607  ORF Transcript_18194/g.46607 Transcript_18194/m.46607 type:complete len:242 (+) Transcript_18194:200-925(+)
MSPRRPPQSTDNTVTATSITSVSMGLPPFTKEVLPWTYLPFHVISTGRIPNRMRRNAPEHSRAKKKMCGAAVATMRGGTMVQSSGSRRARKEPPEIWPVKGPSPFISRSWIKSMQPRPTPRNDVMMAKALKTFTATIAVSPLAAPICEMIWSALVSVTPAGMVPRMTSSQMKYMTKGMPLPSKMAFITRSLEPRYDSRLGMMLWKVKATTITGSAAGAAFQFAASRLDITTVPAASLSRRA